MNPYEVAQQIKGTAENIILVYAFNSTGKTRLCVEYKNLTKKPETNEHTGVYYNAFSEDLFVWNNDEENGNANINLTIKHSSLNQFHSFLTDELLSEKLAAYNPKYTFFFNPNDDPEMGIESISFFVEEDEERKPIKISRGEERIFVWCFFLALFDVDAWAGTQDAHFFIDDPVSSLDEHNIFITADSIFDLVEKHYLKKRIVLTTHHIGLYALLADRLTKGEKSERYKKLTKLFILSSKEKQLVLNTPKNDVFLFHLHLLQILDTAEKERLYNYHFVLLRQLIENISSFLGSGALNYTLSQIGIEKDKMEETTTVLNSLSHKNIYRIQFNEPSPAEADVFRDIFQKLVTRYNFRFN